MDWLRKKIVRETIITIKGEIFKCKIKNVRTRWMVKIRKR
jgi:hypothetical protein